jgi:Mn-dependent DtxR family transcriptional regulator
MIEYDINSIKMILAMADAEARVNRINELAKRLETDKSVVSRKISSLSEDGLVDKSDISDIKLTGKGRQLAKDIQDKMNAVEQHLIYEGMDSENARFNALRIVMYCNDAYFEKFSEPMTETIRIKQLMSDRAAFSGGELAERMRKGNYFFPFVIYREHVKGHGNISMANKGFENPCELVIGENSASVILRVKEMEAHSGMTGKLLSGRVTKLAYFNGKDYVKAYNGGMYVTIPLGAFCFENMARGDSFNNVLHGSVELRVQCSVGPVHMPESLCILTLFMH